MVAEVDQSVSVVFAGALSFGLYACTLLICLRWQLFMNEGWKLRKTQAINWPIVLATLLILVCNLAYLLETFVWTKVAIWHAIHFPGTEYEKPEWTSILSCTVANTNVLLADIVLVKIDFSQVMSRVLSLALGQIVRCWAVYGRRGVSVILFPSFLWIGGLLCTVLQIYLQVAHIKDPTIGPYSWASVNMTMGPGIVLVPFWISTILLNICTSAMLILRIYRTGEHCRSSTSIDHLRFIIHVIAESGVLYFSITIAHFLSWFGGNEFATDIISVLNAPITGIAFNWFLIRIARRKAVDAADAPFHATKEISTLNFKSSSQMDSEAAREDVSSDSLSAETAVILITSGSDSDITNVAQKHESP